MRSRTRSAAFLLVVLAALVGAALAAAAVIEHIRVGGNVRETRGFSRSLLVDIEVLPDYRHVSAVRDLRGHWDGPAYRAVGKGDLGGVTGIDWSIYFTRAGMPSTVTQLTRDVESFNWKVADENPLLVPHVIKGRRVGTLKGISLIIHSPGSTGAAVKSGVTFLLCRGLVATVIFELMKPLDDDAAPFGQYVVEGGSLASMWNHVRGREALSQVSLNGYLPLARVTARAHGRGVTGTVTDCAGHPAPGVVVHVGSARATTNSSGRYTAHVVRPGTYAATASAGGATTASSRVRVR